MIKRLAKFAIGVAAFAGLAACAAKPPSIFQDALRDRPQEIVPRPPLPGYGSAVAKQRIPWTVHSLAADFIELNFESEGGHVYDRLLRWGGDVKIGYVGAELAAYEPDIASLISLLNAAAPGLNASLAPPGEADIVIRTAPRAEMVALAQTALCFFTPVNLDWEAFKEADAKGLANWSDVEQLEEITIFIPAYAAPHTFRICFVEEIMQALGPGNDLYRLEDSGFNDDEVHKAPTAFDLLMIRTLYDDAMKPGMTRSQARVAAGDAIGRFLANEGVRPFAKRRPISRFDEEYQRYHYASDAIEDPEDRKAVIDYALEVARKFGEDDHRLGEALRSAAYYESDYGELTQAIDLAEAAVEHFERTLAPDAARLARMRSDLAYFLILNQDFELAIPLLEASESVLAAHAMDAEYASALRLRALALASVGEPVEARRAARRALAWAAYVFGGDADGLSRWRKEFKDFDIAV